MATLQEAIRIVLETEGREGIDALRASLASIGDVSADTVGDTTRLLDSLAGLNEAAAKASRFGEMAAELEATTQALDNASAAALQLSLQIGSTDKPSKEMLRTYREVRDEVSRLEDVQRRQAAAQAAIADDLRASGVDTSNLADANRRLRTDIEGATQALTRQVSVVQRNAEALRRQRQATEEADDRFRQMARGNTAAADSLRAYRERAEAADASTRRLGRSADGVGGTFTRLRTVVAGAFAFLGITSAVEGVRNLLGIGSAAESARRSLQNLYGSQEAGNRAFAQLDALAKRNGIAIAAIVDQAKKLKAFGIDPLNGSLQSLIDQNAAVGGSLQDLDGKILAVGQAWAKQKLQGEEILQLVERGVPVWDLLQKATGKNVTELQKLSEQGKLGRDVIKALLDEIGKANSGAAAKGLTGLDGLVSAVSSRWQDFLKLVADSGVTDYFKTQLQSLLGSTGNLDLLAKRVASAIIGVIETLRRLAVEFGPFVATIGNATAGLLKHADALVIVAKAYAAVKIAGFYQSLATGLLTLRASTAATAALGAEATRASGLFGRLGGSLAGLGGVVSNLARVIKISALGLSIDFAVRSMFNLIDAVGQYQQMLGRTEAFQRVQHELQADQVRLGQQLQNLYRASADVAVESGARVSQMTRDQASDYQFALEQARNYYGGVIREARAAGERQAEAAASEKWKELGAAITAAKERLTELDREAAKQASLNAFVDKAIAKFDQLATKTKSAKEAVNGIFEGIDFTGEKGVDQVIAILEQVNARGTAAGKAIQAELRSALQGVSTDDLPRLKAAADDAFGGSSAAAKQFAAEVNRINLGRLGIDVDAIKSGFTAAGRTAVDAFRGAIEEVEQLGLTVEQRSAAIAQAFDNAFRQASTKAEIQALKQSLQEALTAGSLGFTEFQQRVKEADAKLAELGGTGQKMGQEIARGASQAADSLDQVSTAAESAASSTQHAADAAEASADRFEEGSKAGQSYALTLVSVSEKAQEMYRSVTEAQSAIAGSAGRFARGVNEITGKVNAQAEALRKQTEEAEAAAAADDEWAKRRAALAQKFDLLGADNIERLVEAEKRAAQVQKRRLDDAQRARDQAKADGADPTETIQIATAAQQQAAVAAQAVTDVLSGAREAAAALSTASTQIAQGGEIVVRIVQEVPPGALAFRLNPAQEESIARRVVQLLLAAKKVST